MLIAEYAIVTSKWNTVGWTTLPNILSLKAQNSTHAASNLFLFDKMSSSPKTPAAKKSAAKKVVKSQNKTLIGNTKTKEEVKMYSFFYKKNPALLRATNFSQKES